MEWSERARRRVAVHKSAHAVVATLLGVPVRVRLSVDHQRRGLCGLVTPATSA